MQDKVSFYSQRKQIINARCFVKSYVDERELEKNMEVIWKGIIFTLKTATTFNLTEVDPLTFNTQDEFLISIDSPKYRKSG